MRMHMLTAEEIRKLRKRLQLTRTEFAAKIGVTEGAVWKWEADQQHPRWKSLVKLAELLEEIEETGVRR